MGREARRMEKGFVAPLRKTWWGYLLPAIPCKSCENGRMPSNPDKYCLVCGGDHKVWPQVKPPGFPVDEYPYANCEVVDKRYGWQMWETTSEGSPISPVCNSAEELARWLADNGASSFGAMTASYEQWLRTIQAGSAPSMVLEGTNMMSGVAAVAEQEAPEKEHVCEQSVELLPLLKALRAWDKWFRQGNKAPLYASDRALEKYGKK